MTHYRRASTRSEAALERLAEAKIHINEDCRKEKSAVTLHPLPQVRHLQYHCRK